MISIFDTDGRRRTDSFWDHFSSHRCCWVLWHLWKPDRKRNYLFRCKWKLEVWFLLSFGFIYWLIDLFIHDYFFVLVCKRKMKEGITTWMNDCKICMTFHFYPIWTPAITFVSSLNFDSCLPKPLSVTHRKLLAKKTRKKNNCIMESSNWYDQVPRNLNVPLHVWTSWKWLKLGTCSDSHDIRHSVDYYLTFLLFYLPTQSSWISTRKCVFKYL